ncbi:hypothetical protein ACFV5N_15660 [Streptomyces sp. NPDC059853]|uniref:hypothetical protein n=1 Tax=Streptomyces sp. NPDC059853 TaxID=3346973 RepID=UPI0036504D55
MSFTKNALSTLAIATAVVGGTATQALAHDAHVTNAPIGQERIINTPAEDSHLTDIRPLEDSHATDVRPLEDSHLTDTRPLEDSHLTGNE